MVIHLGKGGFTAESRFVRRGHEVVMVSPGKAVFCFTLGGRDHLPGIPKITHHGRNNGRCVWARGERYVTVERLDYDYPAWAKVRGRVRFEFVENGRCRALVDVSTLHRDSHRRVLIEVAKGFLGIPHFKHSWQTKATSGPKPVIG